jgi:hypothetical protein
MDSELITLAVVNFPNFAGLVLLSVALWRILRLLIRLLQQSLENQSRLEQLLRECLDLDKEQKRN